MTVRNYVVDNMITKIASVYGMESETTLRFCRIAQKCPSYNFIVKYFEKLLKEAGETA